MRKHYKILINCHSKIYFHNYTKLLEENFGLKQPFG